jgi:hypothetical protein
MINIVLKKTRARKSIPATGMVLRSKTDVNSGSICYNKRDGNNIMIILGAQTKEYIMAKIPEVSKHGTTVTKLMHNLPLTHRRLRRIVAELVDRRFLKFLVSPRGLYYKSQGTYFS